MAPTAMSPMSRDGREAESLMTVPLWSISQWPGSLFVITIERSTSSGIAASVNLPSSPVSVSPAFTACFSARQAITLVPGTGLPSRNTRPDKVPVGVGAAGVRAGPLSEAPVAD